MVCLAWQQPQDADPHGNEHEQDHGDHAARLLAAPGADGVAVVAKRAAIGRVVHQFRVRADLADVVRLGCRRRAPAREAIEAQRMLGQERGTERAPVMIVSAIGRVAAPLLALTPGDARIAEDRLMSGGSGWHGAQLAARPSGARTAI
jgi:hypothetical protein